MDIRTEQPAIGEYHAEMSHAAATTGVGMQGNRGRGEYRLADAHISLIMGVRADRADIVDWLTASSTGQP